MMRDIGQVGQTSERALLRALTGAERKQLRELLLRLRGRLLLRVQLRVLRRRVLRGLLRQLRLQLLTRRQ